MIKTGQEYRNSIREDRIVYINGERVKNAAAHPVFNSPADICARIYGMPRNKKTNMPGRQKIFDIGTGNVR